ncbi:cysteine-rich receptor-like protein kinase 42 isoform X2 [Primulina huaijiensis]|uniref:cysteine-rich receptor-like protein kinase 42 isoform X2 n=1 Tax=Primulina huaijiensis TaxID=1492673 RepID=UPI003CC74A55
MSSRIQNFTILAWIIIFIFFSQAPPFSLSDPRIFEAGLLCGKPPPVPNSSYIPVFVEEMRSLSQRVTADDWGNYTVHSADFSIYSLAQCHSDLSHDDCLQCYAASRTRLPRCLPSASGRIFLDGCFLRYDNYSFFDERTDPVWDKVNCNSTVGVGADVEFGKNVAELMDNLTAAAVANRGHAADGIKGVFGLAECWKTLTGDGCSECLAKANREVKTCLPSREGRALNAGCYLRYSTVKFFSNQSEDSNRNSERSNLGRISYSYNKSNLNFKYETLERATNYFDSSRKLGQGGAGSVYKGTLSNGQTIAVKRLFFSTRQWVDEFFNEINLISGVEHKNLVKLLGCSIEGPESLLVYEFVPNKSLEECIRNKAKILNWKERFNIIVGTAEGIAFLHGGCSSRIIHRDIKSSNILLDENFNPKIADFGLARCFAADKTHLSTGIAGTLGYMAPEYLVKGQLTEKADVYSFGVLVLEIVCGRKNNAFEEDSGSLLKTVWKLYKTNRLTEVVDPLLKGDFPSMEISKVLKIGLLCTQASVAQRPSMEEVVRMLVNENCEIPEPNQPPFLNSMVSADSGQLSYSTNSSSSNTVKKLGDRYSSAESSSIQSCDL